MSYLPKIKQIYLLHPSEKLPKSVILLKVCLGKVLSFLYYLLADEL